jgi:hypothetical protein
VDLQPAIDDLTHEIDELAAESVRTGKLSSTFDDLDFEHRLARINQEDPEIASKIWNGTIHSPGIFQVITHPNLLDVAERLCGKEIVASSVYRVRPKVPSHIRSAVPWHQDSGYFEPYCDKHMVLTVWLPLVNATTDNGCLWVLPGCHRGDVLPHHPAPGGKPYLYIDEADLPKGVEPVPVEVPKGGVLLMTNITPHVSFVNKTDGVRWSLDLRYQSAALPTNAEITKLPGDIEAAGLPGEDTYVPPACYPPEADFLVRSQARPEQVVADPHRFAELRSRHSRVEMASRWD